MELDKEAFLQTDFGCMLKENIERWDDLLTRYTLFHSSAKWENKLYLSARFGLERCSAHWSGCQAALQHVYGISYYFTRTDEYFGVCTEDEKDWLFKIERV